MAIKRLFVMVLFLATVLGSSLPPATAGIASAAPPDPFQAIMQFWQGTYSGPTASPSGQPPLKQDLLAKAQPDECFDGVGNPYPEMVDGTCPAGSQKKVNQAYVWGLAKSGNSLWFGTAPNVHCLVIGGYLGQTTPIETDSYVCEFGDGVYAKEHGLPAAIGDARPTHIYLYDLAKKTLTDKTPWDDPNIYKVTGLRSAGTIGDIVFLGGPGGGITLFAFNTKTGQYLGSKSFPEYSNIRKWLVVRDPSNREAIYTGVANARLGGQILRWTGSLDDPFKFEVVGNIAGGDPAELAYHEGRIFISSWPRGVNAGLYMGPVVPAGGLTSAHAAKELWPQLWNSAMYDPDGLVAATYGGGAIASFGGYLYWGTMHVPMMAGNAFFQEYGQPTDDTKLLEGLLGTHRAISIFRGKNFGKDSQKLEVVYGETSLPAYNPGAQAWELKPTKMERPLLGHSGFGNFFNNYTWNMTVYRDQLYVGTMDWSYLAGDLLASSISEKQLVATGVAMPRVPIAYGADLMRFSDTTSKAEPYSLDGLGNYANYGIRTSVADGNAMYLGTANPMNLLTDESGQNLGGWELIRVSPRSGPDR